MKDIFQSEHGRIKQKKPKRHRKFQGSKIILFARVANQNMKNNFPFILQRRLACNPTVIPWQCVVRRRQRKLIE